MVWRLGGLADWAPGLSVGGMIDWRVDGLAGRRVDALAGNMACRLTASELEGGFVRGVCVGLAGRRSLLFCSFPHNLYIRQHILPLTSISLHTITPDGELFSALPFEVSCIPAT